MCYLLLLHPLVPYAYIWLLLSQVSCFTVFLVIGREVYVSKTGEKMSRLKPVDDEWILRRLDRWGAQDFLPQIGPKVWWCHVMSDHWFNTLNFMIKALFNLQVSKLKTKCLEIETPIFTVNTWSPLGRHINDGCFLCGSFCRREH
jgi:hypothetical protein